MRKSLILVGLLLAGFLGFLPWAHQWVNQEKESVEIQETVLYGDPAAAKGLQILSQTTVNQHLFWDTIIRPGTAVEPVTKFDFSQSQRRMRSRGRAQVGIYSQGGHFGMSGAIDLDEMEEEYGRSQDIMVRPIRDVASRTEPGKRHTETVYLKKYYDYYPISFDLYDPERSLNINEEMQKKIGEHFLIPVPETQKMEITVERHSSGQIVSVEGNVLEDDGEDFSFYTSGVVLEDGAFFLIPNYTWSGRKIDVSHLPDGYGIYFLPFSFNGNVYLVEADQLSMVFPLDDAQMKVIDIRASDDESQLLLFTEEEGAFWMTTIDRVSMEQVQKLKLADCLAEESLSEYFIYPQFLVVSTSAGRVILLDQGAADAESAVDAEGAADAEDATPAEGGSAGKYHVRFAEELVPPGASDYRLYLYSEAVMAYDGNRLAIAQRENYHRSCRFWLLVCDPTGVTYAGLYDQAGDIGEGVNYNNRVIAVDGIGLKLSWNEGE